MTSAANRTDVPWARVSFSGNFDENFEANAARAASLGATHIDISSIPAKPRHEKTDPADPYLEYSFVLGCLFRFVVPDESLRVMTPKPYEEMMIKSLQSRCEILAKHGLRAKIHLLDPHALPESVYQKHPEWRGPRVDYPPRARRPYFAPCIDHPEVLELYRQGVKMLLTAAPQLDMFRLVSNDSGSGVCWSQMSYSGCNGPSRCKDIPYGQRMAKFMQTWRDGGADAGVDVRVSVSPRGMSPAQAEASRQEQGPECFVVPSPGGFPNTSAGSGGPPPTLKMGSPITFVDGLSNMLDATHDEARVGINHPLDFDLFDLFLKQKPRTQSQKLALLTDLAGKVVISEHVDALLDIWYDFDKSLGRIAFIPWKGLIFEHGVLSKRWLTRPFVCDPEKLTPDETDYWAKHMFDAGGYRETESMMNIHAWFPIDGANHGREVWLNTTAGAKELISLATQLDSLAEHAVDNDAKKLMQTDANRWRVLSHLYRTVGNACAFQTHLDLTKTREYDASLALSDYPARDPRRDYVWELLRDEMENVLELANVLEQSEEALIRQADKSEEEDCFTLGPNVVEQLRKKAQIMGNHLNSIADVFPWMFQVSAAPPEDGE